MNYYEALNEIRTNPDAVAFRPTFKGAYLKVVHGVLLLCEGKHCDPWEPTEATTKTDDWLVSVTKHRT